MRWAWEKIEATDKAVSESEHLVTMDTQENALFFKALGDANRLHILRLVAQQEDICACTLLDELDVSQPTLSHHMKLLRDSGLVHARKSGRWMHYTLNHERFAQARDFLSSFCS